MTYRKTEPITKVVTENDSMQELRLLTDNRIHRGYILPMVAIES